MKGDGTEVTDYDALAELRSYRLLAGEQKVRDELESLIRHLDQAQSDAREFMFCRFRGDFRNQEGERLAIQSLRRVVSDIRNDILELDRLTSPQA